MEITNLVQQLGGQGGAESLAKDLIGEYGWVVLAAIVALMAKDVVIKFCQSILVFFGNGFDFALSLNVDLTLISVCRKI